MFSSTTNNMFGSFLLFRGLSMPEKYLEPFKNQVGKSQFHLRGNTSCSKSMPQALKFARPDKQKNEFISVLFVIGCQNYERINGFVMNNEAYSAYPSEEEILLCDGCDMFALSVDSNV